MSIDYPILRAAIPWSGPEIDDALLRALPDSPPEQQDALLDALVARGRARGLVGLIGKYHLLTGRMQVRLRDLAQHWAGVLHSCLKSASRQTRLNAIELVSHGRDTGLAYLAVQALTDSDRQIVEWACQSLRNQVERFLNLDRPQPDDEAAWAGWLDDRANIVQALSAALAGYDQHRRTAALEPVGWLAHELEDALRPLLADLKKEAAVRMQEMVWQRSDPRLTPLVYLMLSLPSCRRRAACYIGSVRDRAIMAEIIRQVDRPREQQAEVAASLASVRQAAFFEQAGWWERIGEGLADKTVRFIAMLGVGADKQAQWFRLMVQNGSAAQRMAAMEQLCASPSVAATKALKQLLDCPQPEVAEQAAEELIRRGCGDIRQQLTRRLAHPSPRVRKSAGAELGRLTFDRFWDEFNGLDDNARRFVADKLARLAPDLGEQLSARLTDPDPLGRLKATRMIDLCGLARLMREDVYGCCADPDSRVRSSAIKLVGQVPGPASEELAVRALVDPDRRVRANAVEALEALRSPQIARRLGNMLDHRDNRARANAIKAMMTTGLDSARASLHAMLTDASPAHRLSALWVVQQLQWFQTAEVVLRLAREDADQKVRRRALRTLDDLRRSYRHTLDRFGPGPDQPAGVDSQETQP